ncbi:MAG: hypothetical protein ACRCUY_12785 [Thermoguttaceae bacterium]
MFRFLILLKNVLTGFLGIIAVLVVAQYLACPVYDFAPEKPFSGCHISNPYMNMENCVPIKANFHAHSKAFGGITDGKGDADEIVQYYIDHFYDIPALTNYQSICRYQPLNDAMFVPVYEHGYNIFKFHQVSIGAKKVVWQDYPFGMTRNNMQHILEVIRRESEVLVLAHPTFTKRLFRKDFQQLSGYQLFDVTRGHQLQTEYWDMALSAGRLSFALASDDSHHIDNPHEYFKGCSIIFIKRQKNPASDPNTKLVADEIYDALRSGCGYAALVSWTKSPEKRKEIHENLMFLLENVSLKGEQIDISLQKPAKFVRFIGQNGEVKQIDSEIKNASYIFKPNDSYIRTEIVFDTTFESEVTLILNPFVRYEKSLTDYQNVNRINWKMSLLYWTGYCFFGIALLLVIRRRRHSVNA